MDAGRRGTFLVSETVCGESCEEIPEEVNTEDDLRKWSDPKNWPNEAVPADGEDAIIPAEWRLVVDVETAKLKNLEVQGVLIIPQDQATVIIHAE